MDISQRGIDLIKDYESYSSKAYLCPEQIPTIGWGSIRWDAKRKVQLGDTCTREQAEHLLRKEIQIIEDAIDSYVKVPLTQGQFDCLCSWAYNVGPGWINGKRDGGQATLIKLLNKGKYDAVPGQLVRFKRGAKSGKAYNGLLNRRKRELRELWFSDHGPDNRTLPAPTPAPVVPEPVPAKPEPETVKEPMPQAVKPSQPSTVSVVRQSSTIRAALMGLMATVSQVFTWSFQTASEAGVEAVANQEHLTGLNALFGYLGANMGLVAAIVAAISLIIVIQRRLAQEKA